MLARLGVLKGPLAMLFEAGTYRNRITHELNLDYFLHMCRFGDTVLPAGFYFI